MIKLGDRIVELRKSRGMTQEELASMIGVSAQTISKWENSTNMPDIMLMPVIADIFEVSTDSLFGMKSGVSDRAYGMDGLIDRAYDALLSMVADAIHDPAFGNPGDSATFADEAKKYYIANPGSQSQLVEGAHGVIHTNSEFGIVFKYPEGGNAELLADENAAEFLSVLANPAFRKLIAIQVKNPGWYTAVSLASKCGIGTEETKKALELLIKYDYIYQQRIETEDGNIEVYGHSDHKMFHLYMILTLARRVVNFQRCWYGYMST